MLRLKRRWRPKRRPGPRVRLRKRSMENPLNQFAIKTLIPIHVGKYDISFTNSSLFLLLTFLVIVLLFFFGTARKAVVPGRLQSSAEMLYEFTANMVEDNAGHGSALYVPLV